MTSRPTRFTGVVLGLLLLLETPAGAQPRTAFVDALRDFGLGLAGAYGDEGPRLRTSLEVMRRALEAWDAEIRRTESAVSTELATAAPARAALLHAALGALYSDRGRAVDAEREFDAAVALDGTRVDFRRFQALSRERLGKDATDILTGAVALDSDAPATAYQLARSLLKAGQTAAGVREFERLVTLTPALARAARDNGTPLFIQAGLVPDIPGIEPFFPPAAYAQGFARLDAGAYMEALQHFAEALRGDPIAIGVDPDSLLLRAGAALRAAALDDAVPMLERAVTRFPDSPEPHRLLGHAYLLDQRYQTAVSALRKAVSVNPEDERSRLALARALIWADDLSSAEQTLTDAIAAIPGSGQARYELGLIYRSQGRYAEAIAALEDALRFKPLLGANSVHRMIGTLHRSMQAFDAAAAAFSRRVDLVPNDARAHQELGDIYMRGGRDVEALAEFAIAATLDPTGTLSHASAAQIHLRQARYNDAVEASNRVLAIDPTHREARYVLGTALLRMGRTGDGRRELDVYQQLQLEDAAARSRIFEFGALKRAAAVSAAAGDHEKAIAVLQKIVDADPLIPEPIVDLGLALGAAGRHAEAIPRLETAAKLGAHHDVYRHLADTYRAVGDAERSRQARARYEELRRDALRRPAPLP